MANADGGELVVGIEDDGKVTGVPHPLTKVDLFLKVPGDRQYVQPPLRARTEEVKTGVGLTLLHFEVDWSPEVHQLADGRYLLRVNDANQPFPAEQIAALKAAKGQGLFERAFPPGASVVDLDLDLVRDLAQRLGEPKDPEKVLAAYRLVENRNGRHIPNTAGLLLFGKDPVKWHPRCGIDFVRWEGVERKHGAELNVVKRYRIEGPLSILIERAYETIRPFIRERQQLFDLFFTERLEYPTFAWQEAIVNAVAHRDYSIHGACVEVHMFDDRIEMRSPGLPPPPVTVTSLNLREPIHVSRNPLVVRVLADLGYMRDLGEGIPRMFEEMEREGFYPPKFEDVGGIFRVTLQNQPAYDRGTMEWLSRFMEMGLTGDQKRLLAYAHAHDGRFTSRDYQKLANLDIYGASQSIKELMRKGIARSTAKGSRTYEVLEPLESAPEMPEDLQRLLHVIRQKGRVSNHDICVALNVDRKTAYRIAKRLVEEGWLIKEGHRKWTRYRLA